MSLIYESLQEINKRLDRTVHELMELHTRVIKLEELAHVRLAPKANADGAELLTQALVAVTDYWQTHKKPMPLASLNRSFSSLARKRFGDFRAFLTALTEGDAATCLKFMSLMGTAYVFPRVTFFALNEAERQLFAEQGMSKRMLKKHAQFVSSASNVLSDAEAEAQALRAFETRLNEVEK